MLIPFETVSDDARIWVYQSDKRFSQEQISQIARSASQFLEGWEAHGAPLKGSFRVLHARFLIIAVEEDFNPVSGCSTDASVHFVQQLENELGVSFFDRSRIAFMVDHEIILVDMETLRNKEVPFELSRDTITFNNLIKEKAQLDSEWQQPAGETWLARFIS